MEYDLAAQLYIDMLNEMSVDLGDTNSALDYSPESRKKGYEPNPNYSNQYNVGHLSVLSNIGKNYTYYKTIDNNTKEMVHRATIEVNDATNEFPFKHEEQTNVEKARFADTPKYHATDVTFRHFLNSQYPMRSSSFQHTGGQEMWERLAKRTIQAGHHAYHWDGTKLHELNDENFYSHIDSYVHPGEEGLNNHIVISKSPMIGKL